MPELPSYPHLIEQSRKISDWFFSNQRTVDRYINNPDLLYDNASDAVVHIKLMPGGENEQETPVIFKSNNRFLELMGLHGPAENIPISEIEGLKGIKYFDWSNITRDITKGKGHGIFDYYSANLDRWFKISVICSAKDNLLIFFNEISPIKKSFIDADKYSRSQSPEGAED